MVCSAACSTWEGAASKAAVVFSGFSFLFTLLAVAVPWLIYVAGQLSFASASVTVWPFGAIACYTLNTFVTYYSNCASTTVAGLFSLFAPLGVPAALTNAAGALAAACAYAAAALSIAMVLHVVAIIYASRAYRGLPGARDECCSCLCCDAVFLQSGPTGRRLSARVTSAALHGVLCILLFSAAGNFGTQVWPLINAIRSVVASLGVPASFSLDGQTLAYTGGALAFLACACDVLGIAAGASAPHNSNGNAAFYSAVPPSALVRVAVSGQAYEPAAYTQPPIAAPTAPASYAPPLPQLSAVAQAASPLRFCPACGAQRAATARFCPVCGRSHAVTGTMTINAEPV